VHLGLIFLCGDQPASGIIIGIPYGPLPVRCSDYSAGTAVNKLYRKNGFEPKTEVVDAVSSMIQFAPVLGDAC
jgi:hypothetical protein